MFSNTVDCVRRLGSLFRLLNFDPWVLHASMQQRQRLKNLDRSVKIIKPFNMKFLQDLILAIFEGKKRSAKENSHVQTEYYAKIYFLQSSNNNWVTLFVIQTSVIGTILD